MSREINVWLTPAADELLQVQGLEQRAEGIDVVYGSAIGELSVVAARIHSFNSSLEGMDEILASMVTLNAPLVPYIKPHSKTTSEHFDALHLGRIDRRTGFVLPLSDIVVASFAAGAPDRFADVHLLVGFGEAQYRMLFRQLGELLARDLRPRVFPAV